MENVEGPISAICWIKLNVKARNHQKQILSVSKFRY